MGSQKVKIQGRVYHATVLLVTDRDQLGRPMVCRVAHDDQGVDITELAEGGPPEFVIAFFDRSTWGAGK